MAQISRTRGRPPLTEQQLQARRLSVSRAAVALFRRDGLTAVSGGEIARAAGVSERTLWRLFRSKESCVEPVLTAIGEAVLDALRSWPIEADLDDYLAVVGTSQLVAEDLEAALAVIAMTKAEPGLRAVWLLLQERTEPALGDVVADRLGLSPDAPEVRVRAAAMNAALRVLADEVAVTPRRPEGTEKAQEHDARRARLVEAVRQVARHAP